jgi:hypothetical protein
MDDCRRGEARRPQAAVPDGSVKGRGHPLSVPPVAHGAGLTAAKYSAFDQGPAFGGF